LTIFSTLHFAFLSCNKPRTSVACLFAKISRQLPAMFLRRLMFHPWPLVITCASPLTAVSSPAASQIRQPNAS
jgi:hypothetical protein